MLNSVLFSADNNNAKAAAVPSTNEAGGQAFDPGAKHKLAQYVCTGCLAGTYYADGREQLETVLKLAQDCSEEYIAKAAMYSRVEGCMKDMPALMCAILASRQSKLLDNIFPAVIDTGKMLRNFCQIIRSGVTGRKSFGTAPRRLIREWFNRPAESIFRNSIGNKPSLSDVIKMVHPHPKDEEQSALYAYLLGKEMSEAQKGNLPELVKQFEAFKAGTSTEVPNLSFQFLTALPLTEEHWKEIARNSSWTTTRMNINTFLRHGVFNDSELVNIISDRLRDAEEIRRSKAFPYQLLTAYKNADEEVPFSVREALQDAMEIATENVPVLKGSVAVCVDVSGSMWSSVTGYRDSATSCTTCVDVAGLIASCILRKNPQAVIVPFDDQVKTCKLNPRDSVISNAQKLASLNGGWTDCSVALRHLNQRKLYPDTVIFVSDNESWVGRSGWGSTQLLDEWDIIHEKNPNSKLVCIDIQPYGTVQVPDRQDIANVGGFSDAVFTFLEQFVQGNDPEHWVKLIESIEL